MNDIEGLQKKIHDLHGCDSVHVQSIPVQESYEGTTVWDGVIEVFLLPDHPQTRRAYAWNQESDKGLFLPVTMLGVPPINSAVDAARAAIAVEARRQIPRGKIWDD